MAKKRAELEVRRYIRNAVDYKNIFRLSENEKRIYSDDAKQKLVRLFKEEHAAILKEEAGRLSNLGQIAKFFEIYSLLELAKHEIDALIQETADEYRFEKS